MLLLSSLKHISPEDSMELWGRAPNPRLISNCSLIFGEMKQVWSIWSCMMLVWSIWSCMMLVWSTWRMDWFDPSELFMLAWQSLSREIRALACGRRMSPSVKNDLVLSSPSSLQASHSKWWSPSFFLLNIILCLIPDTATLGTKHALHYHHNNGDNGKQDSKLRATPLKARAASPDTGPNLDTFGSR